MKKIKVIYNPMSGKKRQLIPGQIGTPIQEIKKLFQKYQLDADFIPTKSAGHATTLAKEAVKQKYETVIAAGGDGTAGEVANGLINSDVTLGILPLGTFMNIARMLGIPNDLEKAVMLLKINKNRKIDVGQVKRISGEKLVSPHYFIEGAGVGLDAEIQKYFLETERGNMASALKMMKPLFEDFGKVGEIEIDGKKVRTKATMLTITNGPYIGASLKLAPDAKLNDHRLTVRLFNMSKMELASYLFNFFTTGATSSRKVHTHQALSVKVATEVPRLVHIDATLFAETPVEFSVVPNALNVICGFFEKNQSSLKRRNYASSSL